MGDRENVVKAIDICLGHGKCNDCPYCFSGKGYTTMNCRDYMMRDALALLKEQEDLGTELTNAVELIHKKNQRIEKLLKEQETQKFFVDESGKITPLPVVVRCKDCKYWDADEHECNIKIGWFACGADWFCADGERR